MTRATQNLPTLSIYDLEDADARRHRQRQDQRRVEYMLAEIARDHVAMARVYFEIVFAEIVRIPRWDRPYWQRIYTDNLGGHMARNLAAAFDPREGGPEIGPMQGTCQYPKTQNGYSGVCLF